MNSSRKPRVSAEKRRELLVAAAVAREALLQTHVKQALELIGLAGNRVSAIRMLGIYVRVNALPPADADLLTLRVLALLGEESYDGARPLMYVEGEAGGVESLPLVGIVRERLRGRALDDLRGWVELHTGSTQVALLELHVVHALRFVELLQDTHTIAGALREYADMVTVPNAINEALYIFVLDRMAGEGLPAGTRTSRVSVFGAQQRARAVRPPPADRRRKGAMDSAAQ